MPENTDYIAVIHQTVAASKELAEFLQEKIAHYPTSNNPNIELGLVEVQNVASQLRITANLVAGLLEENQTMQDRLIELVDRVHKKD